ncbi:dynamin family protein [Deinococcus sp.]|uniref:dynamin family protein n=1 Tax=Deinococcus sp. TaxID=47478 RepID=UPI00286DFAF6|nr:dynamin family protein [Deinococcus sp.]
MLVTPQVQSLLTRERGLLADLQAFLVAQGAPPEAVAQARQAMQNLGESFLLVVVGEFNAGKSSFINALLGEAVLPEGVTPTTDRIYVLVHGERVDGRNAEPEATGDPFVVRLRVPIAALDGVALVDTPGTNAIVRQHQVLTEGFLPRADLLLFLTSADRPFTESERQFLALAARWGRTVIMVVNKADLLETPEQREEVRAFVEAGARRELNLTPPVYLVSARREQRAAESGGDEGFRALRAALQARLGERERTRLKLSSPLNAAAEILGGEERRASAARDTLKADLDTLGSLEAQRQRHQETMQGELDGQLNRLGRLLSEFEARADKFIDASLRLGNFRTLINGRAIETQFREQAISDLPDAIERQFATMIDRFVEANLHFWEDVQAFLIRRQPPGEIARTRFSYDRHALIEGIAGSASRHIAEVTEAQLTRQLAADTEEAMKGVVGLGAGGVGIGVIGAVLAGTLAADFTFIFSGLAIGSLGLLILPARRLKALRQLRLKVTELRESLEAIVRREYGREQERADARLQDAMSPFTRFIEGEQQRLQAAQVQATGLRGQLAGLQNEVGAV